MYKVIIQFPRVMALKLTKNSSTSQIIFSPKPQNFKFGIYLKEKYGKTYGTKETYQRISMCRFNLDPNSSKKLLKKKNLKDKKTTGV